MDKQWDIEQATAYALGESEAPPPQDDAEAQGNVEELRKTAGLLSEVYAGEASMVLGDARRRAIRMRAEREWHSPLMRALLPEFASDRRRVLAWAGTLAALLVVAGVALFIGVVGAVRQGYTNASSITNSVRADRSFHNLQAVMPEEALEQLEAVGYMSGGGGLGAGADGIARRSAKGVDPRSSLALRPVPEPAAGEPGLYLIKRATLVAETEDARAAAGELKRAVRAVGGYVSSLNERTDGLGRRSVQMEVRVPADKLDTALEGAEGLGKVLSRQVSTQDVSEEYVDTESRMRNLKRTEERLLGHLDRAGKLEDIIKAEHEIGRVRGQIEQFEGRLRFLKNRIAYSSISVTLQETPAAGPITPERGYSSGQVFTDAARSLVGFLQRLWTKVIWVVVWSPVWGGLVVVGLLGHWLVRRRLAS